MNKNLKKLAIVVMLAAALVMALAGCGPKKPTADDAKNYVQAVLDVMCTGDYDHSVELADVEEGKETELRDEAIDEIIDELAQESSLSDEVISQSLKLSLVAAVGSLPVHTSSDLPDPGAGKPGMSHGRYSSDQGR